MEQRRSLLSFLNRPAGWAYDAAGAWLLAVAETAAGAEEREWSTPVVIIVVVATMTALSSATPSNVCDVPMP